jgi:hypothetical protein
MAIPKRLHYDSTEFSRRLHSVHAAFLAIPKRLHYDPLEFSRRLLLPHLHHVERRIWGGGDARHGVAVSKRRKDDQVE